MPHSLSDVGARVHDVEQAIEDTLKEGLHRAEQSILTTLGHGALRATRFTIRIILWTAVVAYFATGVVILATRYWLLPDIDRWRPQFEAIASRALQVPVSIARIDASWRGLNPHLALNDVRIADHRGDSVLALPRVEGTLSWSSLAKLQPQFVRLRILSPQVDVALLSGGRMSIAGFLIDPQHASDEPGAADWLLEQGELLITDARLHLRDERTDAPSETQFDNVNLSLVRDFGAHRIGIRASPVPSLAAPIDVRGQFRRPPFERASDFSQWSGEVYASVDYVDLAQLNRWVQLPIQVERAHGALRAWATFDRSEIVRTTADFALQDFDARLARDLEPLQLGSVQGRITQQRWGGPRRGGQALSASGLTFRTIGGEVFPPLDLTIRTTRAEGSTPAHTELQANQVNLERLSMIATHIPVAKEFRDVVSRHAIRGQLSNIEFSWDGERPEPDTLALQMRFAGLTSAAQAAELADGRERAPMIPGFQNLSGSIEVSKGSGRIVINSRDAALVFPGVFAEPRLPFSTLAASIQWRNSPQLEVKIDSLAAANSEIELSIGALWRRSASASGYIDLTGRINRLAVENAHHYVPLVAGAHTLSWLRNALISGQLSEGAIRLRGELARFPFSSGEGEFRASAKVRNATVDVAPDSNGRRTPPLWPLFTDIDADLLFERSSMTITANRARTQSARVDEAVVRIPDLGKSAFLEIRGQASGTLSDMLRFVNTSPVAHWIGGVTESVEARGNAKLDLRLDIPLKAGVEAKVIGGLQFIGNDLTLAGIPPFSRVTGTLGFTERGARFSNLNAGFVGGAVRLDSQVRADGATVLSAAGTMTPAGLRPLTDTAILQRVLDRSRGSARYNATLTLHKGTTALQVDSDLAGIAIDGVAPLRKAQAEVFPLHVERLTSGNDREDLRITAAKVLNVRLESQREGGESKLTRGIVAINEAATLPESGLTLNVNVPRLDVEAWTNWFGERSLSPAELAGARSGSPDAGDPTINAASLRTGELVWMRRSIRNVRVTATRPRAGGLDADVSSDSIVGRISWRPDAGSLGRISAQLTKLVIPTARKDDVVDVLKAPTKQIPSIELTADNVELGEAKLGRVDLLASNTGLGANAVWRLRRLEITNPDMKLSATGDWQPSTAAVRRMQMKFALDASDVGATLTRLGYRNTMAKGRGHLEGDIDWQGSPLDIDYPSLSGKIQVKVDNGRFLKVDAGNAARLLQLLSLQSLSRSLGTEARESFGEGFAFTSIVADASIARGVLTTQNFRMAGSSAAVLMSGSVNLSSETQQLHIVVLPEIDASTAALALTAVNPVIGLGTLLAQTVLRDPLSKAFALEYDVSGSWTDPVVTRRNRFAANAPESVK